MHDFLTRGGPFSPTHRALLAETAEDLVAVPPEPAGGNPGPATSVHAGDGNGRVRAPEAPVGVEDLSAEAWAARLTFDKVEIATDYLTDDGALATQAVGTIYAAVQRVLSEAGPLPLAAPEPWIMSDDEFAALVARVLGHFVLYRGEMLDDYGYDAADMIRPRLVPVEG